MVACTKCEACVAFLMMIAAATEFWLPAQRKTNMWITLANTTGQDSICLATASPENPFHKCLVGIPLDDYSSITQLFQSSGRCEGIATNCNNTNTALWSNCLPEIDIEPQELELLGSVPMDTCIQLTCEKWQDNMLKHEWIKLQNVNATLDDYRNETRWCNASQKNPRGVVNNMGQQPQKLPYGVFLICGDRAWPGIPSNAVGRPCSLGRLTLLMPNASMIVDHRRATREKCFLHRYKSKFNDNVDLRGSGLSILGSLVPGVGTAQALNTLEKLGCWLTKQTNRISKALSELLLDVDSVRHATLQNRAAIDFLLLAQGHGCEDFDGMCCMNLSDHSESIHKSIQLLKDGVQKLQVDDEWDWLNKLFSVWGLSGWLLSVVKMGLIVLMIIVAVLLMLPCMISLLQRALQRTTKAIFLAQIQKGGIVGNYSRSENSLTEGMGTDISLEDIKVYLRKTWE